MQSDAAHEGLDESLAEGAGPGGCGLTRFGRNMFIVPRVGLEFGGPVLVEFNLPLVDPHREPNEVREMR